MVGEGGGLKGLVERCCAGPEAVVGERGGEGGA